MQWPPTKPGLKFKKFHLVPAASKTSDVSMPIRSNIKANSFTKEILTSRWAFSIALLASATLIDAKLQDGAAIPGQSDKVYSLTAYYERNGFEVRLAGTDRSDFLTYQRGGSNKIETANRKGVRLLDAQISYDFAESDIDYLKGLRVSLQGSNLTDVDEETVDANGIVTLRRQFGPTYMLNFNYSFY